MKNTFSGMGFIALAFFIALLIALFKGEDVGPSKSGVTRGECSIRFLGAIKLRNNDFVLSCLKIGFNPNAYKRGIAPIHVVALVGNTEAGDILLRYGANVNLLTVREGLRPLDIALVTGNKKTIRWLKDNGAVQTKNVSSSERQ